MSEFLIFILEDASFQIAASIVSLTFTLILLYNKLFRYALILGFVFLAILAIVLKGPFGQELVKKFRGQSTPSLFMYNIEWDCGADLSADTIEGRWQVVGKAAPKATP